jgi:hypothetical protein
MRAVVIVCTEVILPLIDAGCVTAGRPQILHPAILSIRLPNHHVTVCHCGAKSDREIVALRDCHLESCMCLIEHVGLEEVQAVEFLLELSIYFPKR